MSATARARIPTLDALRGVAILAVLAYHLTRLEPTGLAMAAYRRVMLAGWLGVDLFFVLSGFLITGILLESRSADGQTARRFFGHFYARRTRRIFPLYYAALAALLFVVPRFGPNAAGTSVGLAADQAWHWTYLSNWLWLPGVEPAPVPTASHFWSLAIEEQFYLVWPAVVWFTPTRWLPRMCLGVAATAIALRMAILAAGMHPGVAYHLTITRVDALALGAAVACWIRSSATRPWLDALIARWSGPVWLATAILLIVGAGWRFAPVLAGPGYTLLAISAAALIGTVVLRPDGRAARVLERQWWLRRLGTYSYGLYVYHYIVRGLLEAHGWSVSAWTAAWGSVGAAQLAFYTVAGGLSLALAVVSWHWFEAPILDAPRRRRRSVTVAATEAA